MKKYRVSLALKIPTNFEIEVNAKTEKDAFKKALGKFYKSTCYDYIQDPDWSNIDLDIDKSVDINAVGNGIDIEEID
ncbi:hypothetical protein HZB04_04020 [Candidatus Wolfebacteria bacterium]|nr:hypothetical protein [Candidatus Wolfebacteria bacterium]